MSRVVPALLVSSALAALAACTLTHPLDRYSEGLDSDAATADAAPDRRPTDAGDGCSGDPHIIIPASGATVGASVRVTACRTTMILDVDDKIALHIAGTPSTRRSRSG